MNGIYIFIDAQRKIHIFLTSNKKRVVNLKCIYLSPTLYMRIENSLAHCIESAPDLRRNFIDYNEGPAINAIDFLTPFTSQSLVAQSLIEPKFRTQI